MPLPECFCWTRFGTEAGQTADQILDRKEQERVANGGLFIWGIGNAVGPSIRALVRRDPSPEVIFSPITSAPKTKDVNPRAVAAWTSGETLEGSPFQLPDHSLVTSRYDPDAPREGHYALVCFSGRPLHSLQLEDKIALDELANLLTGRRVGASQVTAIVRHRTGLRRKPGTHDVAIRAVLVHPYFIRLRHPVVLPEANREYVASHDWIVDAVRLVRERTGSVPRQLSFQAT
jgi:hypothetical protein